MDPNSTQTQVTFADSYAAFIVTFPEFSVLTQAQVQAQWNMATGLQRNDGCGPVTTAGQQVNLLNLVTAHLCALFFQGPGDPNPGAPKDASTPVGRVSSASQGSVSAQFDYGTVGKKEAFWVQTRYGALWWQMTRTYRTMLYAPGQPFQPQPGNPMLPGGPFMLPWWPGNYG